MKIEKAITDDTKERILIVENIGPDKCIQILTWDEERKVYYSSVILENEIQELLDYDF